MTIVFLEDLIVAIVLHEVLTGELCEVVNSVLPEVVIGLLHKGVLRL